MTAQRGAAGGTLVKRFIHIREPLQLQSPLPELQLHFPNCTFTLLLRELQLHRLDLVRTGWDGDAGAAGGER